MKVVLPLLFGVGIFWFLMSKVDLEQVNEVIDKMELQPLKDRLHHLVEMRFRGHLSKCEGCRLCK